MFRLLMSALFIIGSSAGGYGCVVDEGTQDVCGLTRQCCAEAGGEFYCSWDAGWWVCGGGFTSALFQDCAARLGHAGYCGIGYGRGGEVKKSLGDSISHDVQFCWDWDCPLDATTTVPPTTVAIGDAEKVKA